MESSLKNSGLREREGATQATANEEKTVTAETVKVVESEQKGGLSIQPTTVAFQALNFVILVLILHKILYKPLIKLLNERELRIKEGVENAEKAEVSLKEAVLVKQDMLKGARVESQRMLEKARKEGEDVKSEMVKDAKNEAVKIVESGHNLVEMEKEKVLQEVKARAVSLVVGATEKLLREKIDAQKDAKIIEQSMHEYAL